jgi:hypothetical protein
MIDPNGTLLRYDGQRWFPVQLPQASAPPGPTPPPHDATPCPARPVTPKCSTTVPRPQHSAASRCSASEAPQKTLIPTGEFAHPGHHTALFVRVAVVPLHLHRRIQV